MPDTKEYRGNTFLEIEKALADDRDRITIGRAQMEQILKIHAEVTEAKNELVLSNWRLTQLLEMAARG